MYKKEKNSYYLLTYITLTDDNTIETQYNFMHILWNPLYSVIIRFRHYWDALTTL